MSVLKKTIFGAGRRLGLVGNFVLPETGGVILRDIYITPDGLTLFSCEKDGEVNYYNLSNPFDLSSITTYGLLVSLTSGREGLIFSPNGLNLYVQHNGSGDRVTQLTLSSAFDTQNTPTNVGNTTTTDTGARGLYMKPDGTSFFVSGITADTVRKYNLSTPFDITTRQNTTVNVSFGFEGPAGIWFKPDGLKMFITSTTTGTLYEYDLATPWDIENYTLINSKVIADPCYGIFISEDGRNLFLASTNTTVSRYVKHYAIKPYSIDKVN